MDQLFIIKLEELAALVEQSVRKVFNENSGNTTETEKEIMNAKEAAKFLSISLSTLYAKTSQRLIPHTKQGGLYFKRTELIGWLAQSKKLTREEVEMGEVIFKNNKTSKRQ